MQCHVASDRRQIAKTLLNPPSQRLVVYLYGWTRLGDASNDARMKMELECHGS
jgi:hypothetical protein